MGVNVKSCRGSSMVSIMSSAVIVMKVFQNQFKLLAAVVSTIAFIYMPMT